MDPVTLQAIILNLMRAFGPAIVDLIQKQYAETGTVATAPQLDALIVKHQDEIIKKGEDWLKNHPG